MYCVNVCASAVTATVTVTFKYSYHRRRSWCTWGGVVIPINLPPLLDFACLGFLNNSKHFIAIESQVGRVITLVPKYICDIHKPLHPIIHAYIFIYRAKTNYRQNGCTISNPEPREWRASIEQFCVAFISLLVCARVHFVFEFGCQDSTIEEHCVYTHTRKTRYLNHKHSIQSPKKKHSILYRALHFNPDF